MVAKSRFPGLNVTEDAPNTTRSHNLPIDLAMKSEYNHRVNRISKLATNRKYEKLLKTLYGKANADIIK